MIRIQVLTWRKAHKSGTSVMADVQCDLQKPFTLRLVLVMQGGVRIGNLAVLVVHDAEVSSPMPG